MARQTDDDVVGVMRDHADRCVGSIAVQMRVVCGCVGKDRHGFILNVTDSMRVSVGE